MKNKLKSILKILKGKYIVLDYDNITVSNTDLTKEQLREVACKMYRVVYMGY